MQVDSYYLSGSVRDIRSSNLGRTLDGVCWGVTSILVGSEIKGKGIRAAIMNPLTFAPRGSILFYKYLDRGERKGEQKWPKNLKICT